MMRRLIPFLPLALLAACGQPSSDRSQTRSESLPSVDYSESEQALQAPPARMAAGPSVSPTAAPGVAFNYRYAFRLPAARIAEVQEQHAQTCERLGVARCRITGMLYRVVSADDVEAMLAFKLDPAIARIFGRDGVAAVIRAEGMLTESEITGTDVGTAIQRASRNIAEMETELRRIEARLRERGLPAGERASLEAQAQQVRQSIAASRRERENNQDSLANTPMVFNYGSGELVPGPGHRPTVKEAWSRALENLADGAMVLFVILLTLLPWALVIGLIWWGVRKIVRRRRAAMPAPEAESVEPAIEA